MITLSQFKQLLGDEARTLSDDEVESIRDAQYQFSRLAFQKWTKERFSQKILSKSE